MAFYALLLGIVLQLHTAQVAAQYRDGELRLVGGSFQWEGRVEIFSGRSWGTITDSDWTRADAQAICRTLGYFRPGASEYPGAFFGQGSGPIHIDHVVCSGTEYNLLDCETGTGTIQSNHSEDVGVKCNTVDENYRNGDLRLVNGSNNWEGRVEMFWKGAWGTISSINWGAAEAKVVCRQMGLASEGAVSVCCARYGRGTGPIHMNAIACGGSESNIADCKFTNDQLINHEYDVGVQCGQGPDYKSGDIRLVGGAYSWEGRVEIFLNGEWGTISYGSADALDAFVVCRQLGYDTRYGYSDTSHTNYRDFGMGSGAVHLNYLRCYGQEYRLVECASQTNTWEHYSDWGISCKNDNPDEGDIKLYYNARSSDYYKGILQIWLNGQWGTVSNKYWTMDNVDTVCRQLGRDGVDDYAGYYNYYYDLPIVISNVTCVGSESRLTDCAFLFGGSGSPVSLECTADGSCNYGDMRLTGGSTEREGRVEMCSDRSLWGTVCSSYWTEAQSRVVCRSLGFDDAEGSYELFNKFESDPQTPIAVDYIRCQGIENSLKECIHFSHSYGCSHDDDVGVRCQPAKCQDGEVKLLGDDIMQGLVLVCSNKRWGTLCNSQTDENTGTVCRQLGYDGGYIRYYQQDTVPRVPVRVTGLSCHGDETRVFDCSYSKSNESQLCSDPLNIWCFSARCADGMVKLVDGDSEVEGRVEICFSRRWGTVSGDHWTEKESTVVCNDLGYEPTGEDYSVRPATNSMPVFLKSVRCTGRELSLLECGFRGNLTRTDHFNDVAVKCKRPDCVDGDLRLLGGSSGNDGALQVCLDQRWGTVSGDGWTAIDTKVACRQLGLNSTARHYRTTATYALSTPIHMDNVGCHGTEAKVTDCAYHTDTSEDRHSGDIWIECDTDTGKVEPGTDSNTESDKRIGGEPKSETRVVSSEKESKVGLIVGLVALVFSVLLSVTLVGYILLVKQKRLRENIRVHYQKSFQSKDDMKVIIGNDDAEPHVETPEMAHES